MSQLNAAEAESRTDSYESRQLTSLLLDNVSKMQAGLGYNGLRDLRLHVCALL